MIAAPLSLWAYLALSLAVEHWPEFKAALAWWPAIGAFSGKTVLSSVAFVLALRIRLDGDRAAMISPALYAGALVASFPPILEALARALP